ncbi:MAG: hypothetical protein QOH13_605 [Thermoleophilaceae bacterium]|nr:hypothetical protein [Thermoleophilaceae bacterium]
MRVPAALALTIALASPANASTAAAAAQPPTAAGSIGLRLLDVPLGARGDPRARLYVVDHLAPGTIIHRRIQVSNGSASRVRVALYAAAATIRKGSFTGAPGRTRNDLSTWTSVSPRGSGIPAHGSATAVVAIAVPKDAAPGEQYGAVWAEARSNPGAGGGIVQVSRVGIRLYVSVGAGGPPAANFKIDSLTARRSPDGRPIVIAAVHNTGGRALDMNGSLRLLSGPGGLSAGPFAANLGTTLAIGDTEPVTIVLDKRLPAGPWNARVSLRSGLIERRARATITFPATTHATATTPYRMIAGTALLLALCAGATLAVRRQRRLRRAAATR